MKKFGSIRATPVRFVAFFVLMMTGVGAHSAGPKDAEWLNEEVVIRGDYFRAALVAYEDFSKKLLNEQHPNGKAEDFTEYMSKIENYNLKVADGRTRYVVWISPRASGDFPVIFGGSANYILDARTFKIIEKNYSK
jgi:hypothetical protein